MSIGVAEARAMAEKLLADTLPRRWMHVAEVARRASVAGRKLADKDLLEKAAWLHDVGYSPHVSLTGFHPLDGAKHLSDAGESQRLAGLVAFHSSAASEAEVYGVSAELSKFEDERTLTRDLLWYLDMSTGPEGQRLTFEERMAEVRERYPADHYVIRALDLGMPERVAAVERATAWLSSVGLDHV